MEATGDAGDERLGARSSRRSTPREPTPTSTQAAEPKPAWPCHRSTSSFVTRSAVERRYRGRSLVAAPSRAVASTQNRRPWDVVSLPATSIIAAPLATATTSGADAGIEVSQLRTGLSWPMKPGFIGGIRDQPIGQASLSQASRSSATAFAGSAATPWPRW